MCLYVYVAVIIQLIKKLQWTGTKAFSENLTFSFLENNWVQYGLTGKFYSLLYHFCMVARVSKISCISFNISNNSTCFGTVEKTNEKELYIFIVLKT